MNPQSPKDIMKEQTDIPACPATQRLFTGSASRLRHCGVLAGAVLTLLWPLAAQAVLTDYQTAVKAEASLISYYTFDSSNAADTKAAHAGTLAGTTAFASGIGGFGKALVLNGAGRVNLGVVGAFAFTNDNSGSVEAWVNAGNLNGDATVFANRDGYSRWDVHLTSDKSAIGMWNGVSYLTVAIPNASTNWHHLAVVFESAYFTVYWDGAWAGSLSLPLGYTDFTKSTQIGSPSPNGDALQSWVGMLDEVAIYSAPLTAAAVQTHYQAFFAGTAPVIVKQPQGGTYIRGAVLSLSAQADGGKMTYQWYKGSTALSGKTTNTLSFASLAAGDVGTYSLRITNTAGHVTSSNAVVALAPLPASLVSYQTAVSNETSLISYYTFDRLLPADVVGPNQGTMVGTADWGDGVGGGAAKGLKLDGGGYVSLGAVPAFDFASGVGTIEGWIRADWTNVGYWPCMWADGNGNATVWTLRLSSDKLTPAFFNGVGSSWFVMPGGAGTSWHHVATVFSNGMASFYADGELIQYSPMARPLGGGPGTVQLGSSAPTSAAEGWIGMLDEVAVYSTALPGTSIQAHYLAYVAGTPPMITSQPVGSYYLVGQWGQVSVAASGPQLAYQWYKDGALLPSMTNAIVGPKILTAGDTGYYSVVITNSFGTNIGGTHLQVGNNMAQYQEMVRGESSLISYYTFDTGDPRDVKNTHPGTVANTVAYEAGPGGVSNLCLRLDGTGHIDLGQVPDFDFASGSGTVEGWIRPTWGNPASYDPVLFADRNGSGSVWSVRMDEWKTRLVSFSSADQSLPNISDTGWHHYAIVFNSGTVSMYWDGKLRGSFSQTINSYLAKTTQLGSSTPTGTTDGWIGDLDEVAFYNAALGPDAIWNHYLAMITSLLHCSRAGTQLTISWYSGLAGYTLESADSLPAASWTPVSGVVSNRVTVSDSVGMRFFRLAK